MPSQTELLTQIRDLVQLLVSDTDEWLDYKGAAEYLGYEVTTLRKMVSNLEIPHHRDCSTKDRRGRAQGKVTFLKSELFLWRKKFRIETSAESLERMSLQKSAKTRSAA